jgi:hypothetical protein
MLASIVAAAACLCAPDVRFGHPLVDDPQAGAAPALRALPASDADRTLVTELMARQDRCVLDHRTDVARADFTDDFQAPDWNCKSSADVLDRWDDYLHDHRDASVRSEVGDVRRVGSTLVVAARRHFTGIRVADARPVDEWSWQTFALRECDGALKIAAIYETAANRGASFDRERRRYDRCADLAFALTWPEPFVPVPREGPGATLDQTLFLDPQDDAVLGFMAYDPTVKLDLGKLMEGDLDDCNAEWIVEPRTFAHAPAGFGEAMEAEIHYRPEPAKGCRGRERLERAVYLSPDGRMVFCFFIEAPPATYFNVRGKVEELARSIRLSGVRAGRPYCSVLLDRNPRWNTVKDGLFRTDAAAIELPIPEGLEAVPLAGDHILRLRLEMKEDPGSALLLRIFPPGQDRIPANRILEYSVQRMLDLACSESQGDSMRTRGTVDVLGQRGDVNRVEVACHDGSHRAWEIVAVDRNECHIQVQILPRSDRSELHEALLKKVLAALRVRK